MLLMAGCTKTVPVEITPVQQVSSEPTVNTVSVGSPEVITALDAFKTTYNEQNVASLTDLLDLSLKSEIKSFAIVKNIMLYDTINNLNIASEENTSSTGKYVTVYINNDPKPTTFTFIQRNNIWYISDIRSGLSLVDAVIVKSPFQILTVPNTTADGIFTLSLRNSGTKMNQIQILSGTGNCQHFTQQSNNSGVVNIGDDFNLIFYCDPKLPGKNFIANLTLSYLDVVNNIQRETNMRLEFYDR